MGKKSRIKRNYPYIIYLLLKVWGKLHFPKNSKDLYTARFARTDELKDLFSKEPAPAGLHMGQHTFRNYFVGVHSQKTRRELGNILINAPTRGGKGLLAVSQLITWEHSVIVNDIKGDLHLQTAGPRNQEGDIRVFDPTGQGHCYDPLAGKTTEGQLSAAATSILFSPDERDKIFTERATVM